MSVIQDFGVEPVSGFVFALAPEPKIRVPLLAMPPEVLLNHIVNVLDGDYILRAWHSSHTFRMGCAAHTRLA